MCSRDFTGSREDGPCLWASVRFEMKLEGQAEDGCDVASNVLSPAEPVPQPWSAPAEREPGRQGGGGSSDSSPPGTFCVCIMLPGWVTSPPSMLTALHDRTCHRSVPEKASGSLSPWYHLSCHGGGGPRDQPGKQRRGTVGRGREDPTPGWPRRCPGTRLPRTMPFSPRPLPLRANMGSVRNGISPLKLF